MSTLLFGAAGVRKLVEHATGCIEWERSFFDKDRAPHPQLILVHDEGIYLLSNGKPFLPGEGAKRFCVYADGFDPTAEDRMVVWEKARLAVGGDDFSEYLDIAPAWLEAVQRAGFNGMQIEVEQDHLKVDLLMRSPVRRQKRTPPTSGHC